MGVVGKGSPREEAMYAQLHTGAADGEQACDAQDTGVALASHQPSKVKCNVCSFPAHCGRCQDMRSVSSSEVAQWPPLLGELSVRRCRLSRQYGPWSSGVLASNWLLLHSPTAAGRSHSGPRGSTTKSRRDGRATSHRHAPHFLRLQTLGHLLLICWVVCTGQTAPGPSLPLPLCRLPLLQVRKPHFYLFLNKFSELESVEFKFGSKITKIVSCGCKVGSQLQASYCNPSHRDTSIPPHRHVCIHTAHTHMCMYICRHVRILHAFPHTHLRMCMYALHISTPIHRNFYAYTHTHEHTHTHTHLSRLVCAHTTHIHTCMHIHILNTHEYTHCTHVYTQCVYTHTRRNAG